MVAQLVFNPPVQKHRQSESYRLRVSASQHLAMSTHGGQRRGRASSAGAATRQRSRSPAGAQTPEVVSAKDGGGPMTLIEVSQFVRDLMRQHEFDRVAWVNIVAASQNQAQRLGTMEHEMLQVNDELSSVLEGYARTLRSNEAALQDHLKAAFGDTVLAVNAVEQGLLKGIALVKAEFLAVQQGEAALLQELRVKFGQLEMAVGQLEQRVHVQHGSTPIRQPPTFYSMYTPDQQGDL